jgi:arsenical pump membrane protein
VACLAFIAGIVADVPLGAASACAAGLLVAAFTALDRGALRPALVPWRLLVFVTGLFLVVQALGTIGLADHVGGLVGRDAALLATG